MTMLAFIGGMIFGSILGGSMVLSALIFVIYMDEKGKQPTEIIRTIEKKVNDKVDKRQPKIFHTPTDTELAQEKIIKEHSDRGEDTPIEKL